jgi:hypothetical protein
MPAEVQLALDCAIRLWKQCTTHRRLRGRDDSSHAFFLKTLEAIQHIYDLDSTSLPMPSQVPFTDMAANCNPSPPPYAAPSFTVPSYSPLPSTDMAVNYTPSPPSDAAQSFTMPSYSPAPVNNMAFNFVPFPPPYMIHALGSQLRAASLVAATHPGDDQQGTLHRPCLRVQRHLGSSSQRQLHACPAIPAPGNIRAQLCACWIVTMCAAITFRAMTFTQNAINSNEKLSLQTPVAQHHWQSRRTLTTTANHPRSCTK